MQTLLATQCSLFFNQYQKPIKFIAYIYIRFNQNFDEKSCISAKIEAVNIYTQFSANCGIAATSIRGWSGGAMVLGNLPVPGRPTILITVGQGPVALAVGAGGGGLDIFTLIYPFSSFSLSLGDGPI